MNIPGPKTFNYVGTVPSSKSLMNRAYVIKSFFPELQIKGQSSSDDVINMAKAIDSLFQFAPIHCGEAGTVLRFMALRASRMVGEHRLVGSPRLFSRPQEELVRILRQLGVKAELRANELIITSYGWRPMGDGLQIHSGESSQFASAVLLSCWDLPFDMAMSLSRRQVSKAYFEMSAQLCSQLGMQIEKSEQDYIIASHQKIKQTEIEIEMDMSSAFALAALAVVSGSCKLRGYSSHSLQPDSVFPSILMSMGVPVEINNDQVSISMCSRLKGIDFNLSDSPDLFPVLAVLCALAEGESRLMGASNLIHKESNRIAKISELLKLMRRPHKVLADGIFIENLSSPLEKTKFSYGCDQDHRLAMAAAVAQQAGFDVQIDNPLVVNKSFPEFWSSLGIQPKGIL